MIKKLLALGIGITLTILSIFLITGPIRAIAAKHQENGKRCSAKSESKDIRNEKVRTRKGVFEYEYYEITVEYKSGRFGINHIREVRDFVTEDEFKAARIGAEIEISDMGNARSNAESPNILLASTMDSSIFTKFKLAMKGDISEHALGLILLIFGGMTTLISIGFLFSKKQSHKKNASH